MTEKKITRKKSKTPDKNSKSLKEKKDKVVKTLPLAQPSPETPPGKTAAPAAEIPPRNSGNPVVAKPATPEVMQAAAPKPRFGPEEIAGLKFGYDLVQELKAKAGYSIEGTKVRHHEIEFLSKVAVIAVQRTQLANELEFKIKELSEKLAQLGEKN